MSWVEHINDFLNKKLTKLDKGLWKSIYHNLIAYPNFLIKAKEDLKKDGLIVHALDFQLDDKFKNKLLCMDESFDDWAFEKYKITSVFILPNGLYFTDGEFFNCERCIAMSPKRLSLNNTVGD